MTLSQQQAACILANAFLCTWPAHRAIHASQLEEATRLYRVSMQSTQSSHAGSSGRTQSPLTAQRPASVERTVTPADVRASASSGTHSPSEPQNQVPLSALPQAQAERGAARFPQEQRGAAGHRMLPQYLQSNQFERNFPDFNFLQYVQSNSPH